jgi:hypothetical protein
MSKGETGTAVVPIASFGPYLYRSRTQEHRLSVVSKRGLGCDAGKLLRSPMGDFGRRQAGASVIASREVGTKADVSEFCSPTPRPEHRTSPNSSPNCAPQGRQMLLCAPRTPLKKTCSMPQDPPIDRRVEASSLRRFAKWPYHLGSQRWLLTHPV